MFHILLYVLYFVIYCILHSVRHIVVYHVNCILLCILYCILMDLLFLVVQMVRHCILELLSPVALHHAQHMMAAVAVVWNERRQRGPASVKRVSERKTSGQGLTKDRSVRLGWGYKLPLTEKSPYDV